MPQKNNPPLTPPRELAKLLLHVLKPGRLASAFLESYAKQFDRPEATAHPERRRELETILDREMLLAMTAHVARVTEINARTRRTSFRTARQSKSSADPAAFLRELFAAIAKESNWTAGDAMEFRGDLEIYRHLTALAASRSSQARTRVVPAGPFVDRCAILLDPSMIENASRAAGKLLLQLEVQADKLLLEVLNRDSTQKKSR
jgi:hypothetical protein